MSLECVEKLVSEIIVKYRHWGGLDTEDGIRL